MLSRAVAARAVIGFSCRYFYARSPLADALTVSRCFLARRAVKPDWLLTALRSGVAGFDGVRETQSTLGIRWLDRI